jgi:hypothetical protein
MGKNHRNTCKCKLASKINLQIFMDSCVNIGGIAETISLAWPTVVEAFLVVTPLLIELEILPVIQPIQEECYTSDLRSRKRKCYASSERKSVRLPTKTMKKNRCLIIYKIRSFSKDFHFVKSRSALSCPPIMRLRTHFPEIP